MLSWENITVKQFQDVYNILTDNTMDEIDRTEKIICTLYDKTELQIEELTLPQFATLAKGCKFLLDAAEIPGKAQRKIKACGNTYFVEYNPAKLRQRQYVEILEFRKKTIDNLHYIMASLVTPVKYGFIKQKNKAADHARIASEMLETRFIDVYHTSVFFCNVWTNLIKDMQGYLVAEMTAEKKLTKEEANQLLDISTSVMDGFLAPTKLRSLKE
jgi:hypothetical protein